MLKIKFKDLELAMEYIKTNSQSELVEFEINGEKLFLSFFDKNKNYAEIKLFNAAFNTTPEIKVTSKLYRK